MAERLLTVDNLSAFYGEAQVLRNVSLDVASGEVVTLVGGGMAVYFPLAWLLGGIDRAAVMSLLTRKKRPGSDAI